MGKKRVNATLEDWMADEVIRLSSVTGLSRSMVVRCMVWSRCAEMRNVQDSEEALVRLLGYVRGFKDEEVD